MNVVGFDVGKDSIYGARIDGSMKVKERYEIDNTIKAIRPVMMRLRKRFKRLCIGSEATAEYHRPLALVCIELDIPMRLLNPITTKQFTTTTVRKKKTDITDAEAVARVTYHDGGTVVTAAMFCATKPLLRTATRIVEAEQALKLMQHHLAAVLDHSPAPGLLEACRQQLTHTAVALRSEAVRQTSHELQSLLQSIPGVGPITAATLVAEVGDIARFPDAKALVAYVGLDPRVRQSGKTLQRNTRLTKRGSPHLRRALFFAAMTAVRTAHDEELRAAYDKKRSEGKRYKEAIVVVARKLTMRVYAVWKRNEPYVLRSFEG